MRVVGLKIHNILSIEDADISFDETGLMLIQGWNHDSGRANGAGKTAIFNALTFALYDKLPRKITATEILRRGSRSGYVEATVEVGQDRYVITRSRPKGVSIRDALGNNLTITQEELESKLKLNYAQYTMIAYCVQGAARRFLSVNDADKKTFLLQLLNLAEFAASKAVADEKVKNLTRELEASEVKIQAIDSKVDAYSESLVDSAEVKSQIEALESDVAANTREIISLQAISKPDLTKYQKLEDDISAKKSEIVRARTRREILHEQYRRESNKRTEFHGEDVCSLCGSAVDTSVAKAAHSKEMSRLENELRNIKLEIDRCDEVLIKEKQILELSRKLKDKKAAESHDYEVASVKIIELQQSNALKQQTIKNLNVKLENNSELTNKIQVLTASKQKLGELLSSTRSKIELYKTVSAMYSPTGAQAYILDSVIESFNERVSEYVNLLWSNVSYELQSYKENVTGDITAKFSEQLVMDGKEISIGSLSGGEYRALSLCVDFALIDVMESQFGIWISPVTLDEPFDGLDSVGRELIIELLEKLSAQRQIVVVDHASEVATSFSNVLKVEKRNGISMVYKTT